MNTKKILPPTYLFSALIIMLILHFIFPGIKLILSPWNLFGLFPLIIGIALNLAADGALRKAGTTVKPFEKSTNLITTGVYRVSRHPMYLGFVLILIGVAILLGSAVPWLIIPIFYYLMEVNFIRIEERKLEEQFGSTWSAYKKLVRRWL